METTGCSCRSEFQVAEESDALVQESMTRLRPHFRRREAHQHAADYLRGLIADLERKNGWQLAEHAGYHHPRGMQRVLDRYTWDHQAVREDLRQYVVTELGILMESWWWMRLGSSNRGNILLGWPASTAAPWARLPTVSRSIPGLCQSQGSHWRRWGPLRARGMVSRRAALSEGRNPS